MNFIKSIYFQQRVFWTIFGIAGLFLFSFWIPQLYAITWILLVLLLLAILLDTVILFSKNGISAQRILSEKFSNSDQNPVTIQIQNKYRFKVYLEIIDELPVQFQKRDFLKKTEVGSNSNTEFQYFVRPVERGEYYFGKLNLFVSNKLKLVKKRLVFDEDQMVKVYPSIIQMRKYDFLAIDKRLKQPGLKKIRRIGHTQDFEQIKEYVPGDDIRSINWKATAKQAGLMVNQYQDEKAQPVYSVIDTGRLMKMPFNRLSLLDYSINSSLAFSNVALQKKDKVGLLSFSNKIGSLIPASAKKTQLNLILHNLYNITTEFRDSDFGLLYTTVKRQLTHRSLLMLYTNFEHMNALSRQLPYLKALSKKHIVVVVLFENTELEKAIIHKTDNVPELAHQIIAEDFYYEKRLIAKTLQQHGIQTVLTRPEELTVNTINKYLEIKARGIL